jgi:acetyl esterase/lipase
MLRRFFLCLAILLAATTPAAADLIHILAPFNLPGTYDTNVVKLGDNVPFADGQRFRLDVYAPQNPTGPAPVVMFIYGGAWEAGEKSDYEFVGRAFASQGFVAVIPDYRVYPEVAYPKFLEDNAAAVRWIEDNIARYGGDPGRFFLSGHSAGAYTAVMLGLDRSFLREYGVTMPIRGIAAISGPYDFYPFEYDQVRHAFGDAPNPEGTQPVNLVQPDVPPMLLMSGTTDPIVRVQNTEHLAERLKAQNDWVSVRYYEGAGHMEPVIALGALWRWRFSVLADITEFFQRFGAFPGGQPRPPGYTPEPPAGQTDMKAIIARLDTMFAPISNDLADE